MVEQLSPEALREKLRNGDDVQVIDTRPPEVFEAGHLPGAENVPYAELASRIDEIEWRDEIVLVCEEGISSVQAGRILESYEGIDEDSLVASLDGGYEAWPHDLETE